MFNNHIFHFERYIHSKKRSRDRLDSCTGKPNFWRTRKSQFKGIFNFQAVFVSRRNFRAVVPLIYYSIPYGQWQSKKLWSDGWMDGNLRECTGKSSSIGLRYSTDTCVSSESKLSEWNIVTRTHDIRRYEPGAPSFHTSDYDVDSLVLD